MPRGQSADSLEKAQSKGLGLIKFRPRSESELRQRLTRAGCNPAALEKLIADFKQKGFLDDAKFAAYFATGSMMSKPMGRRAILDRLKAKGIDPGLASQAAEKAMEGKSDEEVARQLAQERLKRLGSLPPETLQRRLFGFLSRRGFAAEVVYRVVRELTSDEKF